MGLINTLLSIIFPSRCVGCRRSGTELCPDCLGAIRVAERESASWIFPVFDYRDPVIKRAIWLLKYGGRRRLAAPLAESVYEKMLEELADRETMENFREPVLVPVPLSGARRRERGYNQAALIAAEILRMNRARSGAGMTLDLEVLAKPRDTEHQARIRNRGERLQNIRGTFAVKYPERVQNKNIILIDDILTTGATLTEARKVLRAAGARKVMAFTIAH